MKTNLENNLFFTFFKPIFKKNWYVFILLFILIFSPFLEGYFYKQIIDSIALKDQQMQEIGMLILSWGGMLLISLLAFSIYRIFVSKFSIDVEKEYVKLTYQRYWSLPLGYQIAKNSGEFFAKLQSGQQAIWNIYSTLFLHILPSWLGLMIMLVLSSLINLPMTLILFLLIPIQYFILNKGIVRNKQEVQEMNYEFHKFFKIAQDSLSNVMMVKSFFKDQEIFQLIWNSFQKYSVLNKKVSARWGKINIISHVISVSSRLIIFIFGVYLITSNQITLGTFIMFFTFSNLIFHPIQQLGEQIHKLQMNFSNLKAVERLVSLSNLQEDNRPSLRLSNLNLKFSNVSFAYQENQLVLKNISFSCQKNTITALVGHSGSGKSTITNLINKFYQPISGQILIDNQDLNNLSDHSVRSEIGVVFQDNMMFNDTIQNNIILFNPNFSEINLQRIIELADLKDFISKLPEGLQTVIGERGLKVSGGEKQRIAIARALFKDPSILIFDEATSSLDTISESKIQKVIKNIAKDRLTIIVAHRLSTILIADQIIVIDNGEVDSIGTHDELLKSSKVYRDLVESQYLK